MRDKQFIINSIKMDLYRVVTAVGDTNKELPQQSVIEFMEHANKDFEKIKLSDREKKLKQELKQLLDQLPQIKDSSSRLRWAENILTVRCRL